MESTKNASPKMRRTPLMKTIFDFLKKVGIRIEPYYIILEGLFNRSLPQLETGLEGYSIGFLGPEDMKAISVSAIPDRNTTEAFLLNRLKRGNRCFGAKHRGKVAAFTWYGGKQCNFHGRIFPLKENEAALFDAYTLKSHRGKGIAPYIRYRLYKELANLGKDILYSDSDFFNTPSIRFKTKLNAKLLELRLCVRFKRWHFHPKLKKYRLELSKKVMDT